MSEESEAKISKIAETVERLASLRATDSDRLEHLEESVDKLAIIMANGFVGVNQRLDRLETDVTVIKSDVAELKTNVDDLRNESRNTRGNVQRIDERVTNIESHLNLKPALA